MVKKSNVNANIYNILYTLLDVIFFVTYLKKKKNFFPEIYKNLYFMQVLNNIY